MKRFFRWPAWLLLAAIALAALIPSTTYFHAGKIMAAHAKNNTTPTITLSTSIVHPKQMITLSGQGFGRLDAVDIYIDSTSGYYLGSFYCDQNGNLSAQIQMPASYILQGQHTILAQIYLGASATAPVTFVPIVYPIAGRPGFSVQLTGAAFSANETTRVYWGTSKGALLGTSSTDSMGNFSFSFQLQKRLSTGSYSVTIARTNQKPAQVRTQIKIFPETMTSTPGIHSGQPVNVRLTGFLPGEYVAFSWSANGGQGLNYFSTDSNGALKAQLFPPSAPPGSYALTATGGSSGEQTTNNLNVGPGISGGSSNPGSTITVTGGGFNANETVDIYFQTKAHGVVSATTDSTGSFTTSLTLPMTYNPTTTYYIYASNTAGTEHTRAKFTFLAPLLEAPAYVYYNEQIGLNFANFGANESVSVIWNYQQPGQFTMATVKVDETGGLTNLTINAPSTPHQNTVVVAAIGASSKLVATSTILNYATLLLNPATGTAGTQVKASGGNFGSNETVAITFEGTTVATASTDANGIFATTFKIPSVGGAGNITVQASGGSSGLSAQALFTYMPVLVATPSIVKGGDVFVLTGKHFTANASITITWANNPYGSFGVHADVNGSFTTTIAVQQGFGSGTYYAVAQDFSSYITVSVPVVVE